VLAAALVGDNPYKELTEDSLLLEPTGKNSGRIDEVNGSGAELCPKFVPTEHELLVLAKYWFRAALEIDYDDFLYQHTGSRKIRVGPFALRRIARMEPILGTEVLDKAYDEVQTKFASEVNPELWDMFISGEEPARDEHGVPILAPTRANKSEPADLSDVKTFIAVARRWTLVFKPGERH